MCRFKDDPEWGRVLNRFCDGSLSPGDFALINPRVVVNGMTRDGDIIPPNIQHAAHANRDRCAVNTASFGEFITQKSEKALLVFSDNIEIFGANEKKHKLKNKEKFWTECSKDDIKFPFSKTSVRIDPMLKLCTGCPLMVTENTEARAGVANGTQATFEGVMLKFGKTSSKTAVDVVKIDSVFVSDISHVVLKHSSGTQKNNTFQMVPKRNAFVANCPKPEILRTSHDKTEKIKMSANQIPATGHKLQGSSKDNICIGHFKHGLKNWCYVVLSRVRTRQGLFLMNPLDPLENFDADPKLDAFLARFRHCKTPRETDFVFQ
jgi:hypothetical protein